MFGQDASRTVPEAESWTYFLSGTDLFLVAMPGDHPQFGSSVLPFHGQIWLLLFMLHPSTCPLQYPFSMSFSYAAGMTETDFLTDSDSDSESRFSTDSNR